MWAERAGPGRNQAATSGWHLGVGLGAWLTFSPQSHYLGGREPPVHSWWLRNQVLLSGMGWGRGRLMQMFPEPWSLLGQKWGGGAPTAGDEGCLALIQV